MSDRITIHVKLFARARDMAGTATAELELPAGARVGDLRTALTGRYPALQPLAGHLLVAVNNEYAGDETLLDPSAEIACFPPVSGG